MNKENSNLKKVSKIKFYKTIKKVIGITAITGGVILLVPHIKKPIEAVITKIVEYDNEQFEKEFEHTTKEVKELTGRDYKEIMMERFHEKIQHIEESKVNDNEVTAGIFGQQFEDLKKFLDEDLNEFNNDKKIK